MHISGRLYVFHISGRLYIAGTLTKPLREWLGSYGRFLPGQVEFADTLILNKCDLVTKDELEAMSALLQRLNPGARLLQTSFCSLDVQELLLQKRCVSANGIRSC
jgi:G3E family GTPase